LGLPRRFVFFPTFSFPFLPTPALQSSPLALVTKTKESSFPSLQAEYLNILKQANYKLWAWSIKPQERLVAAPSMAKGPSVLLNRH
jgi:hypothetical protein